MGTLSMKGKQLRIPSKMLATILLSAILVAGTSAQKGSLASATAEEKALINLPSPPWFFPCREWQGASGNSLYSMALHPSMIGDTTNNKRCKIIDARKCATCACDYYVRYSEDGGASWLGLTFGGVPGAGGTGCPGNGGTSSTQAQALAWLQDEHINKGRCGCKPQVSTCKWTSWVDRDDPTGKGDYEFDPNQKKCKVEKYEVSLVSGGPVYTNVADVPTNVLSYSPSSSVGPQVYCVSTNQPGCKVGQSPPIEGWKVGPSPPCCLDYKARFCCSVRAFGLSPIRGK